LDTKWAMQ